MPFLTISPIVFQFEKSWLISFAGRAVKSAVYLTQRLGGESNHNCFFVCFVLLFFFFFKKEEFNEL